MQVVSFLQQQVSVTKMSLRYIIITATAGALVVMSTIDAHSPSTANGLMTSILLIYMTYTLLAARRLVVAIITGVLLSLLQLSLSAGVNFHDHSISKQVRLLLRRSSTY